MKKIKKSIISNSIIGICAGFITGFFSTGGGMIVLPAIIHIMKLDEKKARATTIFSILPMVIVASVFYYKDKYFDIPLGIKCAIGGIIGAAIGSKVMPKVRNKILQGAFIIFLLYAAGSMIFR